MQSITAYLGIYICALIISLRSSNRLRQFLKKHQAIADEQGLQEFKSMARHEMYESLFLILLLAIGVLVGLTIPDRYGIWREIVFYVPLVSLLWYSLVIHRKLEREARSLPAATEELEQAHYQVSKAWKANFLPNF